MYLLRNGKIHGKETVESSQVAQIGRTILVIGIFISIIGILLIMSSKIPWLGKLPGDILIKKKNFTFYFPLATGVLLSILLSLLFYFMGRK